jgi:hypothetical protein
LINLSFIVGFVLLSKIKSSKLYFNLEILRSFQVGSVLNFSVNKFLLGGIRYLNKLIKVNVFKVHKKSKLQFFDENSILSSIQYHPYIPNILYAFDKFYLNMSNLTTKSSNAVFMAEKLELYPYSNLYIYKYSDMFLLHDKDEINNIIRQIEESKKNVELSDRINNDPYISILTKEVIGKQIESQIGTNFKYVEKDSDIINILNEIKKIID